MSLLRCGAILNMKCVWTRYRKRESNHPCDDGAVSCLAKLGVGDARTHSMASIRRNGIPAAHDGTVCEGNSSSSCLRYLHTARSLDAGRKTAYGQPRNKHDYERDSTECHHMPKDRRSGVGYIGCIDANMQMYCDLWQQVRKKAACTPRRPLPYRCRRIPVAAVRLSSTSRRSFATKKNASPSGGNETARHAA